MQTLSVISITLFTIFSAVFINYQIKKNSTNLAKEIAKVVDEGN